MVLTPRTKASMMQQETEDTDIVLITITHSAWSNPIRLSTHPTVFIRTDGNTGEPIYGTLSRNNYYYYVPMQASLPSSQDEQSPEAKLVVSNVSRVLSPYLRLVDKENPRITLEVVNSSTPNIVDVAYPELELSTVNWDANNVEATVINNVASSEPVPWLRFNLANFPNMQEG